MWSIRCLDPLSAAGSGTGQDLERVLTESDFVLLCCALTAGSRGLMNERRLALMRPEAVLINVGRCVARGLITSKVVAGGGRGA